MRDFNDDLAGSEIDVAALLVREIPGAVAAHRAHTTNDRKGTDWWVETASSQHISVDVKARGKDYAASGDDDYALETYSVIETQAPGWTRDESKLTDYVLWVWKDTGRWALVPFKPLCAVFMDHWRDWREEFRTEPQHSIRDGHEWHSECVFVPRRVLWGAIYRRFSGHIAEGG